MNSRLIQQPFLLLCCIVVFVSCDWKNSQNPKISNQPTHEILTSPPPAPTPAPEVVPPLEGLAKGWIDSNLTPNLGNSIGWIIFNRDLPIKTWSLKNEIASFSYEKFFCDDTFSASDTVCIPIFARQRAWGLAYLKSKREWLWIKETPENAKENIDRHNEFGRFESWPLRSPGVEEFEGDWVLCVGTLTYLTKESSTIRSAPDDNANIVCNIPVQSALKPTQPKFTAPRVDARSTAEASYEVEKYKQINKASYSGSVMVKIIESKGDWIRVRPSDWNCGTWGVDTYDDVIGRVLLKWHPSVSGWVKWRVPGPIKGSYRVVIDIVELVGC